MKTFEEYINKTDIPSLDNPYIIVTSDKWKSKGIYLLKIKEIKNNYLYYDEVYYIKNNQIKHIITEDAYTLKQLKIFLQTNNLKLALEQLPIISNAKKYNI